MKTLTNLTADINETDWQRAPVHHPSFGEEATYQAGGKKLSMRRTLQVGPEGLVLTNGKESVAIPIAALWELAETAEVRLKFPETAKVTAES